MDDEMSVQGSGKSQAVRQPEQLGYPLALKLPSGKEHEADFILLADIFPTGYFGASNGFNRLSSTEREDCDCSAGPSGPDHVSEVEDEKCKCLSVRDVCGYTRRGRHR